VPAQSDSSAQSPRDLLSHVALTGSAQAQLQALVSLASSEDAESRALAQQTLSSLPDEHYISTLAESGLLDAVARYFLNPANLRPALLPHLLRHPETPQDAITHLAGTAGPEVVGILLEHLDVLKTPALEALKRNPACQDAALVAQRLGSASQAPPTASNSGGTSASAVSATERLAMLVALAHDADPAERSLAEEELHNFPDEQCMEALHSSSCPEPVLRYFLDPAHARPSLLTALLIHPASPQEAIVTLAGAAGPPVLEVLLDQLDLLKTPALVALKDNSAYLHWQKAPPEGGFVLEIDLLDLLIREAEAEALAPPPTLEPEERGDEKAEATFSKIAKMPVAKRVILALRGSKEERAILIRDGSKAVARAVLGSPKLTESEVEAFACLKNISQDILRLISMNRKFMKNYVILKNLINNPRLPIDVGLTLLNRLMTPDVRSLAANRDVSDTLRKMAAKLAKAREH